MKNLFFSAIPFVLLNLRAPDVAAGGGGSAPKSVFDAEKAPEITGDTLENKVSGATSLIGKLFTAGKDLLSRLSTSENERTKLEGQFNAATTDLENEKGEHTKTKGLLSTANTQITGLTTERDNANNNVARLEKLCNLRGIDPNTVVPPANKPENTAGNVWEQYSKLRDDEKKGAIKPGTAFAFYQKNQKELKEYQNSLAETI